MSAHDSGCSSSPRVSGRTAFLDDEEDAVISRQGRRCEGHLIRIHRSMIVNVDRVRELKPAFHGEFVVILHGGTRLRCSRAYPERLTKAMGS